MATPQKLCCQVNKITDHGDHVYTVDLASERPLPRFKPGQFLHLTLDAKAGTDNGFHAFYIAGPRAMIQALTGNLLNKDIAPEMIKVDAWE